MKCPLCGAEREAHACSNVPPEREEAFAPVVTLVATGADLNALVDHDVSFASWPEYDGRSVEVQLGDGDGNIYARLVDPNRRGGGW